MHVFAIDPGSLESGWVRYDGQRVCQHGIELNPYLLQRLADLAYSDDLTVVVEQITSYGHVVGQSVFQTIFWAGRFCQQVEASGGRWTQSTRVHVKAALCGSARAADADVRRTLLRRFGPREDQALGTRSRPGPLYGITTHQWAALAVAVVSWDEAQRLRRQLVS